MSNIFLVGIFASLICFIVGVIFTLVNLLRKKNKKTSILTIIISIVAFILCVTGFEKTYDTGADASNDYYETTYDPSVYEYSTVQSDSEESSIENSNSENSDVSNFKDFINTTPDFSAFANEYYKYEGEGKASKVRNYLVGTSVKWTGTVIETMNTRIAIIADDKYNETSWTNLSDNLRPYVFFAKDIAQNQVSQFTMGDHVIVSGKIISGGSKLANAQWDVQTESITK